MFTIRRSAIIALLAIALQSVLSSGSANATAITDVSLYFDVRDISCSAPEGCIAELNGGSPLLLDTRAVAMPGMDTNVINTNNFSLYLANPADATGPEQAYLHVGYLFGIIVTNGLLESGEYHYQLSSDSFRGDSSYCAYPSMGGPMPGFSPSSPVPGPGDYCVVMDVNDFMFFVLPGEAVTYDFSVMVDAEAKSISEPSSMEILSTVLIIFGWLYRSSGKRRTEDL